MKTASIQVSSPQSGVPSENGFKQDGERPRKKEVGMLETILIVLVILWALGFFAFHVGGLIHVLLIIDLIVLIIRLLQGRRIL